MARKVELFKNFILGGFIWGVPEGTPKTMSKCSSGKYLLTSKLTGTLADAVQKINFREDSLGVPSPNDVKILVS